MIRKAPAAGQVAVCHECMIAGERIESTHHAACQLSVVNCPVEKPNTLHPFVRGTCR